MKTGGKQGDGSSSRPQVRGLVPVLNPDLPILAEDLLLHRFKSLDLVKPKPKIHHSLSLPAKTDQYGDSPAQVPETPDLDVIAPASRNTLFRPSTDYATLRYGAAIISGKKEDPKPKPKPKPQPSPARPAAKPAHTRNRSRSAVDPIPTHLKPKTPPQITVPRRTSRHPLPPPLPPVPSAMTHPNDTNDQLLARLLSETTLQDGSIFSRPILYRLHPDRTLDITGYPFVPKLRDGEFALPDDSCIRSRCRDRIERMGIGIETEFVIAERGGRRMGLDVDKFGARLAGGHNAEVVEKRGGGVRMGNYMALQQLYTHGKGGPLPEQKGLDEWSLVFESTVSTSREPWGLELRSPLFVAHPTPLSATSSYSAQVPSYHHHVLRTWAYLHTHYTITTPKTCATHIHISLPGGFSLAELRAIAQCAMYFEPAFDALVPSHRAASAYAKSSWLNRSVQAPGAGAALDPIPLEGDGGGRVIRRRTPPSAPRASSAGGGGSGGASASGSAGQRGAGSGAEEEGINLSLLSRLDAIRALENMHTYADLVAAVNPWGRNYAWSFRSLKRLYTVEFREPPASATAEEALGWAELAAGFVRAAVGWKGGLEGERGLFGMVQTVGGLREFVKTQSGDWGGKAYLDKVWERKHPSLFIEAVEPGLTMESGWGKMKNRMEEDRRRIQSMLGARRRGG